MIEEILDWSSGIAWTLTYLIAVYVGFRKKAYCIPAICICLNFSWELFVVSMRIVEKSSFNSGFVSQLLWLILDIGVLCTWLRYGIKVAFKKKLFMLCSSILAMAVATVGLGLWDVAAFAINLIMSVSFLFRLDKRVPILLSVAILKCLGTLPATILSGVLHTNILIITVGGLCLIADLWYIYEIWVNRKSIAFDKLAENGAKI